MGIDSEAKIVFGSLLRYDDFITVLKTFMLTEEEEDEDYQNFYYEKLDSYDSDNRFSKKYNGIFLGQASPYFDSDFENRTFYVAMAEDEDFSLSQVENLTSSYKNTDYQKFLADHGFDYGEPRFLGIVHID